MTELIADRAALTEAVTFAAKALPRSSPLPALMTLRLASDGESLTVSAFDYDTYAAASVEATGPTFDLLVPGQTFVRYLGGMVGERVTITADESTVRADCGATHVTLSRVPLENYPTAPDAPAPLGTIDAEALVAGLASVRDSIDPNTTIAQRRGYVMLLGSPMVVAGIHAQRFSVREVEWSGTSDLAAVVPLAALDGAKAFRGDVRLGCDDGRISLNDDSHIIVARLIQAEPDKFLPMMNLPGVTTTVTFDRAEMIAALRWLTLGDTRKDSHGTLAMSIGTDSIGLALAGADAEAATTVDAKVDGDPVAMGWKAENLLYGLAGTTAEVATLSIQTPRRAASVTADDDPGYHYIAQPWLLK